MSAHTRFALPMNTHGNLKFLHDKAQANADTDKTGRQSPEVTASKQQRHDSKFARKMKMLFHGKKTRGEDAAAENERKRSTMAQLVGSHAFVHMGRR
ncbi:hypothetical protein PHYPSEUDO_002064 [Phytophthora pseudosyringae]|uniref:Uncharacterized protein n=1 Tax=Phytophthora pseudosyringae TaxID=221518 RepID=A0A8T1V2Y1_9STRA|nr:hypothetical protein PHYPSEUDO_002064 [Phytophthora pseudosyringae]